MIHKLASPAVQQFIDDHINEDPFQLSLKGKNYPNLPIREISEQIRAKQKARKKLPEWHNKSIIFPPNLSIEQCSSEITAKYKSEQIQGASLVDLTGGMGIDTFYLAKKFQKVDYVEQNSTLVDIAKYNFEQLGAKNIACYHSTAEEFLNKKLSSPADWIYIDPARRGTGGRVILFEDCEPNLMNLLPAVSRASKNVLIKAAPMLDLQYIFRVIPNISQLDIIAVKNEVKELLIYITPEAKEEKIIAVNLSGNGAQNTVVLRKNEEKKAVPTYNKPQKFIYEPNAAVMKAGTFNTLCARYDVGKLHINSHLYTSNEYLKHFPGRKFQLIELVSMNNKVLKKLIPSGKANITARNFPLTVEQIRKKTGLKDGGDIYIFATTLLNEKPLLLVTVQIP